MSDDERSPDEEADDSTQELLEKALPNYGSIAEKRGEERDNPDAPGPDRWATAEEMREITETVQALIDVFYARGYSSNELSVPFHTIEHTLNAARFDDREFDRIALSMRIRETVKEWQSEQDGDVPVRVLAETIEELGRFFRTEARITAAHRDANEGDDE